MSHLSVRRSVDDVIHRGWRGENGHISSFKMLDPITELRPIQTGHHYGVDQLAWEQEGRGEDGGRGVGGDTKLVIRSVPLLECATVRLSFWG